MEERPSYEKLKMYHNMYLEETERREIERLEGKEYPVIKRKTWVYYLAICILVCAVIVGMATLCGDLRFLMTFWAGLTLVALAAWFWYVGKFIEFIALETHHFRKGYRRPTYTHDLYGNSTLYDSEPYLQDDITSKYGAWRIIAIIFVAVAALMCAAIMLYAMEEGFFVLIRRGGILGK